MSKLAVASLVVCMLGVVAGCLPPLYAQPTVKIGLVAAFEGWFRPLGYEALDAVKLAVSECNERGGVGGYLVELVALNDDQDPESAAQRAREMAVDPDIVGVIGHFGEETTVAALPVYEEEGLALVVPASTALVVTSGGRGVFRLVANDRQIGRAAARYAIGEMGVRDVVSVGGSGDLLECFSAEASASGASVHRALEGDRDSLLSLLEEQSTDLLFFGGDALEGAELLVDLRARGVEVPVLGGNGVNSPQFVEVAGETAEGVTYVGITPSVEDERFAEAYEAMWGGLPGPYATLYHDAAKLLLDALERCIASEGSPSREGVMAALSETENYQGLTGPISFDEDGQALGTTVYVYQIVDVRYPSELRPCEACNE
jgi:branched-chain amino acid transport system substrate-binding protein